MVGFGVEDGGHFEVAASVDRVASLLQREINVEEPEDGRVGRVGRVRLRCGFGLIQIETAGRPALDAYRIYCERTPRVQTMRARDLMLQWSPSKLCDKLIITPDNTLLSTA